jgi:hypothetical protein
MNSINKTARFAGVLYLIIAIAGGFAFFIASSSLIVPGDAIATANNIMASEQLYRIGLVSWSIVLLSELVLSVLLYVILEPTSKTLALIMMFSRLAMTTIQGINLLNYSIPLLLLSGAEYLNVFAPDQIYALVMLFLQAYNYGDFIWQLFFGLHLFVLGYLVYKSGYFPRILGVLLVFASLVYLLQSFGNFLSPDYEELLAMVVLLTIVPELLFTFWLLIKGVNVEQWEKRALVSARYNP